MKKYIHFSFLLLNLFLFSSAQAYDCNCYKKYTISGCYSERKSAGITCPPTSCLYSFSQINSDLKTNLVNNPRYYFEYYQNLTILNQSLINYMNSQLYESVVRPHTSTIKEGFTTEIYQSIDINEGIRFELRQIFRDVYSYCFVKEISPLHAYLIEVI